MNKHYPNAHHKMLLRQMSATPNPHRIIQLGDYTTHNGMTISFYYYRFSNWHKAQEGTARGGIDLHTDDKGNVSVSTHLLRQQERLNLPIPIDTFLNILYDIHYVKWLMDKCHRNLKPLKHPETLFDSCNSQMIINYINQKLGLTSGIYTPRTLNEQINFQNILLHNDVCKNITQQENPGAIMGYIEINDIETVKSTLSTSLKDVLERVGERMQTIRTEE